MPYRDMLNGMLWISKTGSAWRDLPTRFGAWQTVYSRFRLWSKNGVFKKLFEALTIDADMQDLSIDRTSYKVHQHAAGAKKRTENVKINQDIGLSWGGRNTNIMLLLMAEGIQSDYTEPPEMSVIVRCDSC